MYFVIYLFRSLFISSRLSFFLYFIMYVFRCSLFIYFVLPLYRSLFISVVRPLFLSFTIHVRYFFRLLFLYCVSYFFFPFVSS